MKKTAAVNVVLDEEMAVHEPPREPSSWAACIQGIYEVDPLECHPRPDFDELDSTELAEVSRVELGSKASAKVPCG